MQFGVQQVEAVVVGGRADGQVGAFGGCLVHAEQRHVVRALRRAIGVHQAYA
ncbi:hypothetical protein D9M69_375650 [compost metagenome]